MSVPTTAAEIAAAVRARSVSAVTVTEAALARVARDNGILNAIVTLDAERALATARDVDARIARGEAVGVLAGVPIGIKDVTETAGLRTTYGSPLYTDNVPAEDAEVVRRLRAADAVIIGKTNTPEFAAGGNTVNDVFGATRNPWDTSRSAGGSTGGGAAAVASGMIAIAEGSDLGASLRLPAAFCGVVGIRTTAGLVARHPVPQPWDVQFVTGPIARTAEDCALALDAMSGYSVTSPISAAPPWPSALDLVAGTNDLRGLRIAYVPDLARIGNDPDIAQVCESATLMLREAGAVVEMIDFDLADAIPAYLTLRAQWMANDHFGHLDRLDALGANVAGNIRLGLALSGRDVAAAEAKRAECTHRMRALFERFDVLATPTAPISAFPLTQNYPREIGGRVLTSYIDWVAPMFLVSLVGLPAASVPVGLSSNALPIGLQLIGPRFSEPRLLGVARIVQSMRPLRLPAFPIER
jgi:amidase